MKKIIAVVLSVLMLSAGLVSTAGAVYFELEQSFMYDDTYILGDANGDSAINALDALAIKLSLAGVAAEAPDLQASDFDADGKITAVDSYSLKLCIAGVKSTEDFEEDKQVY